MSLSALKFVDADYTGLGVASMADQVSGTPATNKAKFDELVKDVVAVRINAIIDALDATTDGASGADQIACTPVSGIGSAATDTIQEVLDAIGTALSALAPSAAYNTGDAKMSFSSVVPAGWLLCNGSAISRTTYSELFSVIGTSYGAGDGTTTFNIPDARGRFACGLNEATTGPDAERVMGSYEAASVARLTYNDARLVPVSSGGTIPYTNTSDALSFKVTDVSRTIGTAGAETRPANFTVNYFIKT